MSRLILLTPARPRLIQISAILGVALTTCAGCVPAPVDGALRVGAEAPDAGMVAVAGDDPRTVLEAVDSFACAPGRFVDLVDPTSTNRWRDAPR